MHLIFERNVFIRKTFSLNLSYSITTINTYCMYTKEELEQMELSQLLGIAKDLGIKVSQNDELETVIYAILDKAAEQSAADNATTKRKRTRIAKDNSKVYTVNGSESTTLDKKATKAEKKPTLDALIAEQAAAEKAEQAEQAAADQTEE